MKHIVTVLIASLMLAAPLSAYADSSGDARTSLITGNVYLTAADTNNQWQSVSINMPVMQDDTYWIAQDARAEIQFYGSSYLRADEDTEFQVTSLGSTSNTATIDLQSGRLYVDYESSAQGSFFEVDTPLVSVDANQDAQFDISIDGNGIVEIAVTSGSVNADSESGSTTIEAGNMVSFSKSGIAEVSSYTPDDAWMQWNASRNYTVAQNSVSAAYLPPSLADYGYEFDNYGNWVYVATYGYVWTPFVVTAGWAPFSVGSWDWMGGNYVWISNEPWGWVPYHYGRWAFRAGIGWFWVPPEPQQAFWCPGAVAWNYTSNYVSWVPLAPGETYYGNGYYGPHSVNMRNGGEPVSHKQVIYSNARITNAVTVVSRQTFASGNAYRKLQIPENPFLKARYTYIQKPPERMGAQPANQFRQAAQPGLPNSGTRMISRPQQPRNGFRLAVPPQQQNQHNNFVARQPANQFRQGTKYGLQNSGTRMISRPQQPRNGFRLAVPPQQQNQHNNFVARQPANQFRQVTQPALLSPGNSMVNRPQQNYSQPVQPQTPFRQTNGFSRQQQPQQIRQVIQPQAHFGQSTDFSAPRQQFGQSNNFSQQQAPAFQTQYRQSGNSGFSGPANSRAGNVQAFR